MSAPYQLLGLGGRRLEGDRIVRMVYLDESGTGDFKREPNVVVAAAIVHADIQWKAIHKYISEMSSDLVPKAKQSQFVAFHATELYAGGKIFERNKSAIDCWWPILDELVSIPKQFDLPIAFGALPRAYYMPGGERYEQARKAKIPPVVAAQMVAYAVCTAGIERWMNAAAEPNEIAQMIMENNAQTRKFIHLTHRIIADPSQRKKFGKGTEKFFEVSRIMWPVHFEDKADSSALQIADACAWAIRRHLSNELNNERFFAPLRSQLILDQAQRCLV